MIKCSSHILKFTNESKLVLLEKLYSDYMKDLICYIDLIKNNKLPLKALLSSKDLPTNIFEHSQWKQIIYKKASQIIRGFIQTQKSQNYKKFCKCYSYFSKNQRQLKFLNKKYSELNIKPANLNKIIIKHVSINIDNRLIDSKFNSKEFDEFINLKLPYFHLKKTRKVGIQIKLPIKYYKHSLKFKDWKRANTICLIKKNDNFFVKFVYQKENIPLKTKGTSLGIDIGYNKLITTSRNEKLGLEINKLYLELLRKKQGSKNYKDLLTHRNNLINKTINNLDLTDINEVIVEDIKNLKRKGKLSKWVYKPIFNKIDSFCNEQGVNLVKVSPVNTSITCSRCGFVHKDNRCKELFKCIKCNLIEDADYNASLNILRRGVYNPSIHKKELITIKI